MYMCMCVVKKQISPVVLAPTCFRGPVLVTICGPKVLFTRKWCLRANSASTVNGGFLKRETQATMVVSTLKWLNWMIWRYPHDKTEKSKWRVLVVI